MTFNANTTIEQLGGFGKLQAMIGANSFAKSDEDNYIQFKFKGSRKANTIRIELNSMDTYDVTFYKFSPSKFTTKEVKSFDGVYCDQLKEIVESFTGLYLSL